LRIPIRKKNSEAGQAILLVIAAMSVFLLGAVGLAIDGSHLYAQRQLAQAAADAAAQAGIMSMFNGTNTTGPHQFTATAGSSFPCTTSDPTPCYYAQALNGFNNAGSDTVTVSFPTAATAGLSSIPSVTFEDPVIQVTVQRNVPATLMRLLGWSTIPVKARGTAAIEDVPAAIPIIVTHPTLPGSLSFNGNTNITITGGPRRSIQVNSIDPAAIATNACGNATVDLHLAGPNGNGADFGNSAIGNPNFRTPCFTFLPGVGTYIDPASAISDPLAGVAVPTMPAAAPLPTTVAVGTNGCPSVSGTTQCTVFHPGLYTSANPLTVKDSTNNSNGVALFAPGLYYISSGGFNMQSKASAQMATGMPPDTVHPELGTGMVVFNTGTGNGDIFSFDSNAGKFYPIALQGAPTGSSWDGILFMEDPTTSGGVHIGAGANKAHSIQGAGNITLTGTMYFNKRTGVNATSYQALSVQGNAGSTTTVTGEIITNTLSLGGGGQIRMNLDTTSRIVRQVALVQ
jgi:Flp pilus assembly protein TadG